MSGHTKGPWSACGKGKCSCHQVWGDDHPVALVEHGEWGDSYPAIRFVEGKGMSHTTAEAYMEHIPYGAISLETSQANVLLIAAAPELLRSLKMLVSWYGRGSDLQLPMIVEAREAIAKAEGK